MIYPFLCEFYVCSGFESMTYQQTRWRDQFDIVHPLDSGPSPNPGDELQRSYFYIKGQYTT
jgi:hypothetical protein